MRTRPGPKASAALRVQATLGRGQGEAEALGLREQGPALAPVLVRAAERALVLADLLLRRRLASLRQVSVDGCAKWATSPRASVQAAGRGVVDLADDAGGASA